MLIKAILNNQSLFFLQNYGDDAYDKLFNNEKV